MARRKNFNSITGKMYDGMIGRCYRESDVSYKNYGALGVLIHGPWIRDIHVFRQWVKRVLSDMCVTEDQFVENHKEYTLDRIDPTWHYIPENCRLVNAQTQSRNKRNRKKRAYKSAEGDKIYA